jgi:hypothetical protein
MIDMKKLRQKEERKAAAKAKALRRLSQVPLMPPPPSMSDDELGGGGFIDDNELPLYALADGNPSATPAQFDKPRPPIIYASLGTLKAGETMVIGEDDQSEATEYMKIDHERTTVQINAFEIISTLHPQSPVSLLYVFSHTPALNYRP